MSRDRKFNAEKLYNNVVHYYIDKKRYSAEQANRIAQIVVMREARRRTCYACGHMDHHHMGNTGTCLYVDCQCARFTKFTR